MPTVTDDAMRNYLETFRRVYRTTSDALIPPDDRKLLLRYRLLGNEIVGYISSMFGAGYEYTDEPAGDIRIEKSSRRIEDLFWGSPPQWRVGRTPLAIRMGPGRWSFEQATFTDIVPFEMRGQCHVTLIDSVAQSGPWVRRVRYAELDVDRTDAYWSETNANLHVKDELLLALSDIREAERRSVPLPRFLEALKQRYVLLLGDFSPHGRTRLTAVRDVLRSLDYVPVILDELPELPEYDLLQKASVMAYACRFVIVDDSSRAGHLAEIPVALATRGPLIVVRLEGSTSSVVTRGIAAGSGGRVQELEYRPDSLERTLMAAIENTEAWIRQTGEELSHTYPWRSATGGTS